MKPELLIEAAQAVHPAAPQALSDQWLSAAEIAEARLPGLPTTKRKVNERAEGDLWAFRVGPNGEPLCRKRARRGGGLEYHVSILPPGARLALAKRSEAEIVVPLPNRSPLWSAFERLPTSARDEAQQRLKVLVQVERFEVAGLNRSAAVTAAASMFDVAGSTVWNWLSLIAGAARPDWLPLLAPRRMGGGREAEIATDYWQLFLSDYLRPEKPTLSACYERARELADAANVTLPGEQTFRRKLKRDVDPRLVTARRQGDEALRRTIPAQRRSVAQLSAMEAVNIDGHVFDVFVRMPSGVVMRPILVGIQDLYSRKLLAWRLGETESAVLVRLAFADLFKHWGIPKACHLDNGRAFASKWITGGAASRFRFKIKEDEPTGLLTSLGVEVRWTKPYRGQSKPIERAWRELAERVSKHPELAGAYTGNNPQAKPENYGTRAVEHDVFVRVLEAEIARHNARSGRRTETADGKSFDEVFAESYAHSAVGKATEEQLRLALLTGEQVSTDRKSGQITLAGNRYWSPELSAIAGQKVVIRFDPDDLHQPIHVYARTGAYLCSADLWEASGFADSASAKQRAKREADLRARMRQMAKDEQLLAAEDVAVRLRAAHVPQMELVDSGATRPVRHRGQTAAALKPRLQAAPKPVSAPNTDRRLTEAVMRLVK